MKLLLLLALLLSGCARTIEAIGTWTPEAQVELAKRQVVIRAIGMTAVDPQTGIIYCIICYVDYVRNMPPPPLPTPQTQ